MSGGTRTIFIAMHTLSISCFAILLKQHLLRHHADELAPRGRLRPAVEAALRTVPADFEVHPADPLWAGSSSKGQEQRLIAHLALGKNSTAAAAELSVCVQGILARRGVVGTPCLMPFSIRLLAAQGPLTTARVLRALDCLAHGDWHLTLEGEFRVGRFRPQPPLTERSAPPLVRVA